MCLVQACLCHMRGPEELRSATLKYEPEWGGWEGDGDVICDM